jgi:hypothetical protein
MRKVQVKGNTSTRNKKGKARAAPEHNENASQHADDEQASELPEADADHARARPPEAADAAQAQAAAAEAVENALEPSCSQPTEFEYDSAEGSAGSAQTDQDLEGFDTE